MTVSLDIAAIAPDFPHYRVALVVAAGLTIRPARQARRALSRRPIS